MAKRVMLAVAGAGKTYHICNTIQPDKKNLILAYTRENIRNIRLELIAACGCIPELTNIMTFDSFVYRYLLCPYEPTILRHFKREEFKNRGITTIDPPRKVIEGTTIANPRYVAKNKLGHYISSRKQYYCATMSELIMVVKDKHASLIKKAAATLNMFYDQILIDEFQDFREYNYELIIALAKETHNILLVGDYYQHSVSAINNSGKPFKNRKKEEIGYNDFKAELKKHQLEVDETALRNSRRCPKEICEFVKNKLRVEIMADNDHMGQIIWVEKDIEDILENDSITKLVYNNAEQYSFCAVNWSYSKGDTMEHVCVILTDSFEKLDHDSFTNKGIPTSTCNKLYVAMTRTKGSLYFIKCSIFNAVKDKYCKL